jgi:hypothetical protein
MKHYIGKTFKGFKFEDKKYSGLNYNPDMNNFIGEDLQIEYYDKEYNSFFTDSAFHYPAELVIAQLEKQETEIENQIFKPKRGDRVLFSDAYTNEEEEGAERIFLCEIEGSSYPYISVSKETEKQFINRNVFDTVKWRFMKPIPKKNN